MPENPQKILLIMCNWLGDTFLAMQTLPMLQKHYPNATFFVGVKPFSRVLFRGILPEDHILELKGVISDRNREAFS